MLVDEVSTLPNYRLNKLLHTLNAVYGVKIDFDGNDDATLQQVMESYGEKKSAILRECGFNSYNGNEEYTKATLIMEAIKIYLVEIAPKRIRRKNAAA